MMEVVIFTSPACGPCKVVKPELVAQSIARGFNLRAVEASMTRREEFVQYDVRSVPTIVCLEGGQEKGRIVGAVTPAALEAKLIEWGL